MYFQIFEVPPCKDRGLSLQRDVPSLGVSDLRSRADREENGNDILPSDLSFQCLSSTIMAFVQTDSVPLPILEWKSAPSPSAMSTEWQTRGRHDVGLMSEESNLELKEQRMEAFEVDKLAKKKRWTEIPEDIWPGSGSGSLPCSRSQKHRSRFNNPFYVKLLLDVCLHSVELTRLLTPHTSLSLLHISHK
ncbi:hypothetical protein E6O75_ATG03653 [Venturia nashicola]|uniref:Uncharacterized protein n=1 Tax=Venturia nashicola TaxID=86259 RepID=A0A4Z1PPG2_9PEZI|nr:hypothetical protein E6O75_ATG03653 [Venturia nashicola]